MYLLRNPVKIADKTPKCAKGQTTSMKILIAQTTHQSTAYLWNRHPYLDVFGPMDTSSNQRGEVVGGVHLSLISAGFCRYLDMGGKVDEIQWSQGPRRVDWVRCLAYLTQFKIFTVNNHKYIIIYKKRHLKYDTNYKQYENRSYILSEFSYQTWSFIRHGTANTVFAVPRT
jgi:hypothetical protein